MDGAAKAALFQLAKQLGVNDALMLRSFCQNPKAAKASKRPILVYSWDGSRPFVALHCTSP